jgi:hypothetical protein
MTGNILYGIHAGVFANFSLGEYFAPTFQVTPRFRFQTADRVAYEDRLFAGVFGQSLLIEERGSRKYPSRFNVDVRLEKRFDARSFDYIVSGDIFNAFGSDAIVQRNLTVNDGISLDPTSVFGAPRRRVAPLRLQVGLRLER